MSNFIPEDLYTLVRQNKASEIEDYIKTLDYTPENLDLLTNLFMNAVALKAFDTAKILACYGANTHGQWGDWAKYYTMRRRVPFIDPVINRPSEVCEICNCTTLCKCGCDE
jgi:hypothetical protein